MTQGIIKNQEDRLTEVINLYRQLNDLGVTTDSCDGIKEFKKIANTFVKDGFSSSGKIKLFEIDRVLAYTFTMQPHIASSVTLKMI